MMTGSAPGITNPGALKIVTGRSRFALYFAFVMLFSFLPRVLVNLILQEERNDRLAAGNSPVIFVL